MLVIVEFVGEKLPFAEILDIPTAHHCAGNSCYQYHKITRIFFEITSETFELS